MKTKKLNNNKTMRTGVIVAVIAIITLIAIVMTFAKYASQGTGEDSARVARWGVNSSVPTGLDLFDGRYTGPDGTTITVDSSDGANVVAPGTSKMQTINLASFTGDQAPEVMYHFEPTLKIVDQSTTSTQTISMLEKLNQNKAFTWKLQDVAGNIQSYQTYQELQSAVAAMGEPDIAPNHFPSNFGGTATPQIKIGWEWAFEYNGTTANDPSDTEMGNLSANGTLTGLNTTLTLNAYQCQGCSPTPTTVKISGTVSGSAGTVDGATVTYATTTSNVTYTDTTKNGGQYSMDVPMNSNGTFTVTKDGYNTYSSTISVADQPVTQNVTTFDPIQKEKVTIPTAITGLVYDGTNKTGITYDSTWQYYDVTDDSILSATNAGTYGATFILIDATKYVWSDGTVENKTISWEIAKAENPMEFPDQSDTSSVESSEDVEYTFKEATAPEDLNVTYDASSTASSQDNFFIPDHENNVVVCAGGTGADTYTVYLTAKSVDNQNYKDKEVTKSFTWTVKQADTKKAIQSTIDGNTVNFLPAVTDASWSEAGLTFYKSDDEGKTFTELSQATGTEITSMSTLASAINIAGADKVYAETTGATFYGTIKRSWNDTFYQETAQAGDAGGLNYTFKNIIDAAGVKTVYGEYDEDENWIKDSSQNWDYSISSCPTLNGVNYGTSDDNESEFYGAYKSILNRAVRPWSSRANSSNEACNWELYNNEWGMGARDDSLEYYVVLSQVF